MWVFYILLGLIAGTLSGFLGIGGGIIMVPGLVYLWGLTQHQAQGTTLAVMVPPIGLLAAIRYYMAGNVNLKMAVFICIGFLIGGYIGAEFAHKINGVLLKKLFGFVLLGVAIKMILEK